MLPNRGSTLMDMSEKFIRCDNAAGSVLIFNNAEDVLRSLQMPAEGEEERFLTMVQGNAYNNVVITDANIKGNSKFLLDIWD